MGDLEKLLGKKLELEALEFEADKRPAGRFNDGQRAWQQPENVAERGEARVPRENRYEGRPGGRSSVARSDASGGRGAGRPPRAPADPLFDKPYEPSAGADVQPAWEASKPAPARGLSPNIKTRKKVAALFKSAPAPSSVEEG
jgi:ATP-dependent RNA helicase RhlE